MIFKGVSETSVCLPNIRWLVLEKLYFCSLLVFYLRVVCHIILDRLITAEHKSPSNWTIEYNLGSYIQYRYYTLLVVVSKWLGDWLSHDESSLFKWPQLHFTWECCIINKHHCYTFSRWMSTSVILTYLWARLNDFCDSPTWFIYIFRTSGF